MNFTDNIYKIYNVFIYLNQNNLILYENCYLGCYWKIELMLL